MTDTTTDNKTLEKVRALIAKAEATPYEHEAQTFMAKAQELMTRHAIDDAMLAAGSDKAGAPALRVLRIEPPYTTRKATLLTGIGKANHVKVVWDTHNNKATIFGYPSDLDTVELLFTTLLTQAVTAMMAAAPQTSRTRAFRSSFMAGFASRVAVRLAEAAKAAATEAEADYGSALVPVMDGRDRAVADAVKEAFPRLRTMRTSVTSGDGFHAGDTAGRRANIGGRAVAGGNRQLGAG